MVEQCFADVGDKRIGIAVSDEGARATLASSSGLRGAATVVDDGNGVVITVAVTGATPGAHAVRVHSGTDRLAETW